MTLGEIELTGDILRIQYVKLDDALGWLWGRNPKKHDIEEIAASILRYGFRDPSIYDATLGGIAAGNGRIEAVDWIRGQGHAAPVGIATDSERNWFVPLVFGLDAESQAVAEAFGIDHNNLTMAGAFDTVDMIALWDSEKLADLLVSIRNEGLETVTVDNDAVDALLLELAREGEPGAGENLQDENTYSQKVEPPIYRPTGEKPTINELFDESRTRELIAKIEESEDLSSDEKQFLIIASQRHTVLNFGKIAEFYAHSRMELQDFMEDNALVVIDFDKAIELGYVKLSEQIADLYGEDYGTDE